MYGQPMPAWSLRNHFFQRNNIDSFPNSYSSPLTARASDCNVYQMRTAKSWRKTYLQVGEDQGARGKNILLTYINSKHNIFFPWIYFL